MLTIRNTQNNRQTDYSQSYLAREARHMAKFAADSDGKLRAWSLLVVDGWSGVQLRADYLTKDGEPKTMTQSL